MTIPINPDGTAGDAAVFAEPAGVAIDGIALDVHGDVYIANPLSNTVDKVTADGTVETLATVDDGLDGPTSVAFGIGKGSKSAVYVANFSVALGTPLGAGPSVVRVEVGVPGWPQP